MTSLYRLLYASSARDPADQSTLDDILDVSRRKNAEAGISGALLYADGNFIQYVEGPENAVTALWARLERDERHNNLVVLLREPLETRLFPNWKMGYRPLSETQRREIGGLDLSRPEIARRFAVEGEGIIISMMRTFYEAPDPGNRA